MPNENKNYDPLLTMTALNMAIVSLHRITSTKDRLILDQEYKNIINNLRMGEINADPELTGLYQEIVRVINNGRLRSDVREKIESSYSEEKRKSIKEIVSGKVLSNFDTNPLKWLGNLAMSCASEYFTSKKKSAEQEQNSDDELKLKSEELGEYDELQRKLLDSSWKLLRQYELSDSYRLTQNALNKFNSAISENDPSKRLRMLKYIEGEFSMYSPYWFYRAKAAEEANDNPEAEKFFAKFNEVWRPVLRKDPYKVEALKFHIEFLMREGLKAENLSQILECLSEMRENTELEDWANNIYEGTLYFTLGQKEKAIECVMCNVDFEYETENSEKCLESFERETPSADTLYQLGEMYRSGYGVTQDYSEAVKWYTKAAEQGYANAQCNLGNSYYNGRGVEQDYSEAVKWYRKAAEQGNANAQNNLGLCYDNGQGVTQDYSEAVKWYIKAAEQGNADAQCNLGACYDNGQGVTQDYSEAVKWYRKAAEQGNANAQNNLRNLHETW